MLVYICKSIYLKIDVGYIHLPHNTEKKVDGRYCDESQ